MALSLLLGEPVAQPSHQRMEQYGCGGDQAHIEGRNLQTLCLLAAPFLQEPNHHRGQQKGQAGMGRIAKAGGQHQQPVGGCTHRLFGGKVGLLPNVRSPVGSRSAGAPGCGASSGFLSAGGLRACRRRLVSVGQQAHGLRRPLDEKGERDDYQNDYDAGDAYRGLPANGQHHQAGDRGNGAPQPMTDRYQGHSQSPPPPEPVVNRGDGGVVIAGSEAHRHQADEDQQEERNSCRYRRAG